MQNRRFYCIIGYGCSETVGDIGREIARITAAGNKIYHRVLCEKSEIYPEGTKNIRLDGELFPADSLKVKIASGKLRMYRG